jgi:hypothetical protein
MDQFLGEFLALGGIGALIAAVVNILKTSGVVKDGQAPTWVVGLNLLGMASLLFLQVFQPSVDIAGLDVQAGSLATVLITVFGFVWQLISSRLTHTQALSGTPLIGKSYSVDAAK